jgi:hypothetical protein
LINAGYGYSWALAGIALGLIAMAIRDWRILQATLAGIMSLVLLSFL